MRKDKQRLRNDIIPERIKTLDDLRAFLGPLSPEEEQLLNSPMLYADPTQEEINLLGPDFVEHVLKIQRRRENGLCSICGEDTGEPLVSSFIGSIHESCGLRNQAQGGIAF